MLASTAAGATLEPKMSVFARSPLGDCAYALAGVNKGTVGTTTAASVIVENPSADSNLFPA